MRAKRLIVLLALLATIPLSLAQDRFTPVAALPLGDHLLNLPTARIPSNGTWEVRFTHRFIEPINRGDIHSLYGLDSGADVGFGVSWVARPALQFSLIRSSLQDDIELAGKYVLVQQARAFPLSLSLRGGADVRTGRGQSHRGSVFAQGIVSHQFGRRAEISALPTYVSDAGPFDHAFNVPLGAALALRPWLFLVAEIVPRNGGLPGSVESDLGWALGVKRAIGGHYFEILVSNSRATHVDQYIPGAFLCGSDGRCDGLEAGDVHLGFNIERRFGGR